jgi:hypothetical protein
MLGWFRSHFEKILGSGEGRAIFIQGEVAERNRTREGSPHITLRGLQNIVRVSFATYAWRNILSLWPTLLPFQFFSMGGM